MSASPDAPKHFVPKSHILCKADAYYLNAAYWQRLGPLLLTKSSIGVIVSLR